MTSFSTRLMAAILLGAAERIEAATLCVNPGGTGGCFASIQAAVDAADSDDVVDIAAGTYVENVLVPAAGRFTLQGAGAGVTIVDGSAGPTSATLGKLADSDLSISALSLRNGSAGPLRFGWSRRGHGRRDL
jgi:pectin methylesterase-like acyl-CoA thioesterase